MARPAQSRECRANDHEFCAWCICACTCHGKRRRLTPAERLKRDRYTRQQISLVDQQLGGRRR